MSSRFVIQAQDLTIFQGECPVLQDVNLCIQPGEFVFLTGETGGGKTSLLQTLYADLPLQHGEVHVAGIDLKHIRPEEVPFLRRKLGIVFQDFQLLTDRNVEENLRFVLKATGWKDKAAMQQKIAAVLLQVGLDWASKKRAHQLSGGEQQRVAIARALLNDPWLLLADEPTGNLDPDTASSILALFGEISRNGTAVLMATHNYELLAKYPARTLKCHQGRLIDLPPTEGGSVHA